MLAKEILWKFMAKESGIAASKEKKNTFKNVYIAEIRFKLIQPVLGNVYLEFQISSSIDIKKSMRAYFRMENVIREHESQTKMGAADLKLQNFKLS